jgi:hypothetical protein
MGNTCAFAARFVPDDGGTVSAGGDVWGWRSDWSSGHESLWLLLPNASDVPSHLSGGGIAVNVSSCNLARNATFDMTIWSGSCDALSRIAHVPRVVDRCAPAVSLLLDELGAGPTYAELVRPDNYDVDANVMVWATFLQQSPVDGGPSGLMWTCCGGEVWLTLPWLGTMHLPTCKVMAPVSVAGFLHLGAYLVVLLVVCLATCVVERTAMHSSRCRLRSTYRHALLRRRVLLALVPALSYAVLVLLLAGDAGRLLTELALSITGLSVMGYQYHTMTPDDMAEHATLVEGWQAHPHTSPLRSLVAVPRIDGHLAPAEGLPVFTEAEAAAVARRVEALRRTHWTYSLDMAHGLAHFLLGSKLAYGRVGAQTSRIPCNSHGVGEAAGSSGSTHFPWPPLPLWLRCGPSHALLL